MQKISTPSVIDVTDSKILSSAAHPSLPILENDPWDTVLSVLDLHALDPATVVAGLDNAASPNVTNPFITQTLLELRLEGRGFVLLGPTGSDADFEGTTDVTFNLAIASLPPEGGTVVVLPSTYTFNSTCVLPEGVRVLGVHPLSVIIEGSGDFSVFELGDRSRLDYLTIENSNATTNPVLRLAGINGTVVGCRLQNYVLGGVALIGEKSSVRYCVFNSDLGLGVLFQGYYQVIERCTFSGLLPDGVLHLESSMCSALSTLINDSVTGASYNIPAAVCANNKIVASHLGSTAAVAASTDNGTATVRYANTPDTLNANENNFLVALGSYTGQPDLDSTDMVTSNQFATSGITNATDILSSLDLFVQRMYEERNWFLTSGDPTLDGDGNPLTGTLSWDGTTLTWPDFKLESMISEGLAPANEWPVLAGSSPIAAGEALVLVLDRDTPATTTPTIKVLPIAESPLDDPNIKVLAWSPSNTILVWTEGFRILDALTSFDVSGMPLPMARFIGVPTYYKNVPPMTTPVFSDGVDMPDRISSQSAHERLSFEQTNLWKHSDDTIRSHPVVGEWLDLTTSIPAESPSHLIQSRGTTYGLFPNFGFYKSVREDISGTLGVWALVSGFTLTGPYVSMSIVGTSVAIMNDTGSIMFWHPDQQLWTSTSPDTTTLSLPLPSTRVDEDAFGQSDFTFQTPEYTVFTLVDGSCVFYYQESNFLHQKRPLGVESPRGTAVIGRNWKDTGYNVARLGDLDTSDNGVGSTLEGLPLDGVVSPIQVPCFSQGLDQVKWDQLLQESFSHDPHSDAWITVSHDGASNYYVLGGGHDGSRLHSSLTIGTAPFDDFTPYNWLTSSAQQEVVVIGGTSSNEFTVIFGHPNDDPNLPYVWTKSILGGVDSCVGSIGYIEPRTQDAQVLASDLARSYRPTWWTFDRMASTWSYKELSDPEVPAAVANSFKADVGNQVGWGITQDLGLGSTQYSQNFLVRDNARGDRPTLYTKKVAAYTSTALSEGVADVTLAGANGSSTLQFYGGFYQQAWDALVWATQSGPNQVKVFTYFMTGDVWNVMSLGSGGTFLSSLPMGVPSFTHRSGSLLTGSHLAVFNESDHSAKLYVWTADGGLIIGNMSAHYITGYTTVNWLQNGSLNELPVFSANPISTYSPIQAPSRCDLSIQIGSLAEETLPLYGAGVSSDGQGIQWTNPGVIVKQVDSGLWLGLNRSTAGVGYLWIGDADCCKAAHELTPSTTIVGGNTIVADLGSTDNFDFATDGSYLCIVYRDQSNGNRLGFIEYNLTTKAIVHERGGLSNVLILNSTPRVVYNPINTSWEIVAEHASLGRLLYFRRGVNGTWTVEEQWTSMSPPPPAHPYSAASTGKNPGKPYVLGDGSLLVVTESGVTSEARITVRDYASNEWSLEHLSTTGGFEYPEITRTLDASRYWAFGGGGGILHRPDAGGPWTSLPSDAGYDRALKPEITPQNSSVLVASAGTSDGSVLEGQELFVWDVSLSGIKQVGAYTAMGRTQDSLYSGEEETSFTQISWTPYKKVLYGAYRPTRTVPHWSLRGSDTDWAVPQGESLLGSGRMITLGERHFREQWGSTPDNGWGDNLIFEYDVNGYVGSSPVLPVAQRTGEDDFTSIKWPFTTSVGDLFTKGWDGTLEDDTDLASGTLVTSGDRRWPIILGSTRWSGVHQAGPSVFSQGAMLGLLSPAGMTNTDYFGNPAIGSNNLFKIRAYAGVTLEGVHTWYVDPTRTYTLVGPVTFQLDTDFVSTPDALGAHLVLDFNVPDSLELDPTAQPLSYWVDVVHNLESYAVVLGEVREQSFLLYPAKGSRAGSEPLVHGHLEPSELSSPMNSWVYSLRKETGSMPEFEIIVD
jgi:hypothetical protein